MLSIEVRDGKLTLVTPWQTRCDEPEVGRTVWLSDIPVTDWPDAEQWREKAVEGTQALFADSYNNPRVVNFTTWKQVYESKPVSPPRGKGWRWSWGRWAR